MNIIKWLDNSNGRKKTCPQRIGSTTLVTTLEQKSLESADFSGSGAVPGGSGDSKPVGLPLGQVTITSGARSQNWAGKSTGLRNNGSNAMVVKVTPMEVKFLMLHHKIPTLTKIPHDLKNVKFSQKNLSIRFLIRN